MTNKEKLDNYITQNYENLVRKCGGMGQDPHSILHNGYISACKNIDNYRDEIPMEGYIMTIIKRDYSNKYKRKKKGEELINENINQFISPDICKEEKEELLFKIALEGTLKSFDDIEKDIIYYLIEGLTSIEIGLKLNEKDSCIRKKLERLRKNKEKMEIIRKLF